MKKIFHTPLFVCVLSTQMGASMKKFLFLVIIGVIMFFTLKVGLQQEKVSAETSTFLTQIITMKSDSVETLGGVQVVKQAGFNLNQVVCIFGVLFIALVGCIIIAKKNGLFFYQESQETRKSPTLSKQ